MRVLHLITGLNVGGAESMLAELLNQTKALSGVDNVVASMTDKGATGERIQQLGVPVYALHMQSGWPDPRGLLRLRNLIQQYRPTIIQTWLHHADLLGSINAKLSNVPVVWGIHFTADPNQNATWHRKLSMQLSAFISRRVPASIICCSETALREHAKAGYAPEKLHVIHNGVSTNQFVFSENFRTKLRKQLNLPPDAFVIGIPARFHPVKDHPTFFKAAQSMHEKGHLVDFVLCGSGLTPDNPKLAKLMQGLSQPQRFHLLGECSNMAEIYPALDLVTLSSDYETLPITLLEAMSSSRPCVATNVGDCATIIGDTGTLVPRRDAHALSQAWQTIAELGSQKRGELGQRARSRIQAQFSVEIAAKQYLNIYREHQLKI